MPVKSSPQRAIVMAAGEGSRWGEYMDVPKHLIEVDGEPILHRTVRLLKQHVPEVWVVARDDERYRRHTGYTMTVDPLSSDMDKFWSSRQLWEGTHSVLVYGDCYFTEQAIPVITQPVSEWTLFCRPGESAFTGGQYGECWAYSVPVRDQQWFTDRITWLAGAHSLGRLGRVGGWELYRAMLNKPMHHEMYDHFIEINDWTEDFDFPSDYDIWLQRFEKWSKQQ